MSFLTSWLVALFVRWMRSKKGGTTSSSVSIPDESGCLGAVDFEVGGRLIPIRASPEWPRGASLDAEMHDGRGFSLGSCGQPKVFSVSLRRDEVTGKIYDQYGRELLSVEVCSQGKRGFSRSPEEILQALSSGALTASVVTLLLVDNSLFMNVPDSCRMGLHFIDATCVWVEPDSGFGEAVADTELAVA